MQNGDCKDSPEAVPNKAYVISLPGDVAKREVLISVLTDLGLHVEHVEGVLNDQVCHHTKPPDFARAFTNITFVAGYQRHMLWANKDILHQAGLTSRPQQQRAMLPS